MLKVRGDAWHYKVYLFALKLIDRFAGMDEYLDHRSYKTRYCENTNLCHYVRVITIYLPLLLASYVLSYSAVFFTVIIIPIVWFGFMGYLAVIGAMLLIVIGFFAFVAAVYFITDVIPILTVKGFRVLKKKDMINREKGFLGLVVESYKAKKEKFCPRLEVVKTK